MRLKDNLFTIEARDEYGVSTSYSIRLHPECFMYKAHFPGNPITPGVCIIQIGKEIVEEQTGKRLSVKRLKNVKFLSIITPEGCVEVKYDVEKLTDVNGMVSAKLTVESNGEVKAKISMTCKIDGGL